MDKTIIRNIIPCGRLGKPENPPSSEAGPKDSGGQLLLERGPFRRSSLVQRSPSKEVPEHNRGFEEKNEKILMKLSAIELPCIELINEVILLKTENEEIEKTQNICRHEKMKTRRVTGQIEYHTDQEELSRETDWILKREAFRKDLIKNGKPNFTGSCSIEISRR